MLLHEDGLPKMVKQKPLSTMFHNLPLGSLLYTASYCSCTVICPLSASILMFLIMKVPFFFYFYWKAAIMQGSLNPTPLHP